MGLFSRRAAAPTGGLATGPRYGRGRRLRTAQAPAEAAEALRQVLDEYAPAKYAEMTPLTPARAVWHAEGPSPEASWHCSYGQDDLFVITVWPDGPGSTAGLFPLGGSDESLHTPLIGQWKRADPSLTSTGQFEARSLSLMPPAIPQGYYAALCQAGGVPPTAANQGLVLQQVNQMMLLKAHQYMSSQDRRAADRFMQSHLFDGDPDMPQRILDDLGAWNPQLVPYVQDLPWRIRGLLLERGEDGSLTAGVWADATS